MVGRGIFQLQNGNFPWAWANGVSERNYSFRMNIMEEILEMRSRSYIAIWANDMKIYEAISVVDNESGERRTDGGSAANQSGIKNQVFREAFR